MIHHVQLAGPPGCEDTMRAYYTGVLGWTEIPKPPLLAARGGCWFAVPGGGELHIGAEDGFRPSAKAHPAFITDVHTLAGVLTAAGHQVNWADPAEIPGRDRFHTTDPVGNRLEFLAA
ncbi:glyoxalase [Crossiella sp. CA198]|uniref:glyoxalase n=1 Tax=Crossiella sp. CA198 TaxID=3455607 RepID=UPI003F8D5D1E